MAHVVIFLFKSSVTGYANRNSRWYVTCPSIAGVLIQFFGAVASCTYFGEITEDLAVRFGDAIGGLLNATFGNVVEMILGGCWVLSFNQDTPDSFSLGLNPLGYTLVH